MFTRERSIAVNAPTERVFDYVSDLTRHPEWAAQQMRMEPIPPSAAGRDRVRSTVRFGLMPITGEVRMLEAVRPERVEYECSDLAGTYRWTFKLAGNDKSTRLTHRVQRLSAPMWVRLVQPWLMWPLTGGPGCAKGLRNIKARLESGSRG